MDETARKVDILWEQMFPGAKVAKEINAPKPVKYFREKSTGNLRDVQTANGRELFEKIGEEVTEAAMAYGEYIAVDADTDGKYSRDVGMELMDAAYAIYTALECLGFDEQARNNLCREVYEKNRRRGYYGAL